MKLSRQTIIKRIERELLMGKTDKNFYICEDINCVDCEMRAENNSVICKVDSENLIQKVSRKLKLKKLLS